ncbi:MAG TPA: ribonuclease R [Mesotoga infera]|uniref:Ribonuclease R n=1 Tax=Mesotoga infera TaxID=1236046 RepID=A0A7C1CTS7_9BACT|nr:ribonuclease R [Mesotoga infera]
MKLSVKGIREFITSPQYSPATLRGIAVKLGLSDKESRESLKKLLAELVNSGEVIRDSKGRYISPGEKMIVGKIEFARRGMGAFISVEDGEDVFIPPEDTGFSIHGDTVLAEITGKYREIRKGKIVKVINRNKTKVVGTFKTRGIMAFVVADDMRIKSDFYIPPEGFNGARPDQKVLVRITRYPSPGKNPEGVVERVLGDAFSPEADLMTVIYRQDLPEPGYFPEAVKKQARETARKVGSKETGGREDLRNELVYTIDGDDAKDFDDAISLKKNSKGNYSLGIHIADVSHYVREGTQIDVEAYLRGTSVYLLDTVIPMLPFELSNDICSLKPAEDRLTLSLLMEIDPRGKVVSTAVKNAVINSKRRLTYSEVNEFLNGEALEATVEKLTPVAESLRMSYELAQKIRDIRKKRGSVMDISSREVKIVFDDNGKVVDIIPQSRGVSEWIIEEFMILANETVAEIFDNRGLPFVYRIHEEPDPESMMQLKNYLEALGMKIMIPRNVHPKALQQILEKTKDHPLHSSIERVLVRGMKRAVYSERNIGHFGLASEAYTHFTSPIRRYPDLVVHRLLKKLIENSGSDLGEESKKVEETLPKIASWASKRERVANEAEWDLLDMKKVEYISSRIGDVFEGVITGVTKFGIFVELTEKMVSGLVHISTLDDYYDFVENQNILVGRKRKRIFRIGDELKVQVVRADKTTMEIDFSIVKEESKLAPKRKTNSSGVSKNRNVKRKKT